MNLGDPELELIDPAPNVHTLFLHFDKLFFWTKLENTAVVRWSKRMYSCAGVCSYEGRGGLCDIALSEPLLKLRPRKDLVETLLHEMIHAYLFVTCRDQDRDGHGPNFKAHMHRINKFAGLNISIYHDFHDEVELYQTHWWRCNGPCQKRRPHFGIVRRSSNRAPGPSEYWWNSHKRSCGGTFVKIKEPEKTGKKKSVAKPNADITKYINTKKTVNNIPQPTKPILKDSSNIPVKATTKSNSPNTVVMTKNGNQKGTYSPQVIKPPPILFTGKGQTVNGGRLRSNSVDVVETVRNVWANKKLSGTTESTKQNTAKHKGPVRNNSVTGNVFNPNKHKAGSIHADSPPTKVKKIDDYFKTAATVLKDVYGQDFNVTQSEVDKKLVATVAPKSELVNCPICNIKVSSSEINRHLDECLNKEIINNLRNEVIDNQPVPSHNNIKKDLKEIVGDLPHIPNFKGKPDWGGTSLDFNNIINVHENLPSHKPSLSIDNNHIMNTAMIKVDKTIRPEPDSTGAFDSNDINKVKSITKKIIFDKYIRKSDNFIVVKEERKDNVDFGFLPSFLDNIGSKFESTPIKIEPGTSKGIVSLLKDQKCACCGNKIDKPIEEHLDECLAFFANNTIIPEEGASTSFANETIVIDDDDDILDETQTFNATGTKLPCPCCLKMIEEADMNHHLDQCLS